MGVGKTERASLHDSRFTVGRRSDAANDRIIRNLKVKGGKIRKIGDKWTIEPAVPTYREIDEGSTGGGGSCPDITVMPEAPTTAGDTVNVVTGIEPNGHELILKRQTITIPDIPDIPDITVVPEDPTTAANTVSVVTGIEPDGHELTLTRQTITISPAVGYPSAWDIEFLSNYGAPTGEVLVKNPAVVLGGRAVVVATTKTFTITPAAGQYLWGTFDTVNLAGDGFVINNNDFGCELNSGSTPGSMKSPSNTKAYMLLYQFQIIEGVLSVKCDYRNTPTIGIF